MQTPNDSDASSIDAKSAPPDADIGAAEPLREPGEPPSAVSRLRGGLRRRIGLASVQSRIMALALCATLGPAVLTGWLSYRQSREALTARVAETLQATRAQTAREVDLWLKERMYDVRVFASSYEVSENLDVLRRAGGAGQRQAVDRITEYLRSVQERFRDVKELAVTNRRGEVVASGMGTTGTGETHDDARQSAEGGKAVLSAPRPDGGSGEIVMTIAVPISIATGDVVGAMAATLTFQTVAELLARFAPDSGVVYLMDGNGMILTASGAAASASGQFPARVLKDLYDNDPAPVEYTVASGLDFIGTLAGVPRSEWSVVAEAPKRIAFAEIRSLRNTMLLTLVGLAVFAGSIAYVLGALIVRPLGRLAGAAAQVARGDLSVDLPVTGGAEVADLTKAFNDMVARVRESQLSLEQRSITDGLTGLFNRRHMIEELDKEAARSRRHQHPFSLMMIDVDHFKPFNDEHGHQAGDQALVQIARVIEESVREMDRAGRYGGEEFIILLPETAVGEASDVAERLQELLARERFGPSEGLLRMTVSIGLAEFPGDGDTPEAVIGQADAALYQAKRLGRNRIVRIAEEAKRGVG